MPEPGATAAHPALHVVLVPVFDDWTSATRLVARLDEVLDPGARAWTVVLVDDGSTIEPPSDFGRTARLSAVGILRLRRNLGHQRAIAVGLAFLRDHFRPEVVAVMDGDGEDDPADLPRLLDRFRAEGGKAVIFAERRRRTEHLGFLLGYSAYRLLHRVLTGVPVRVGNFSVLPASTLEKLVAVADLWNHYAATVYCSRIPFATVPTDRGRRYSGRSKMNFQSLAIHGLSAIAVFRERVAVRLLALAGFAFLATAAALAALLLVPPLTGAVVPAWAPAAAGLVALALFQLIATLAVFTFVILGSREQVGFLPLRDYPHFVDRYQPIPAGQGGE